MSTLLNIARCSAFALTLAVFSLTTCHAQAASDTTETDSDPYNVADAWLCKPDRADLCSKGGAVSVVATDGTISQRSWQPDPAAAIDCFYVYPTVSTSVNGNSPREAGEAEQRAVLNQFSMFASVCRPFAPLYRQITLHALASAMSGHPIAQDPELAYQDVRAAWQHYLKFDNHGRGVVLIGHSQGARLLTQLLQREIEGKPAQAQLVSAILAGFNIEVLPGTDTGGSFQHLPLCKSATQTGCVITYESFRADAPPPEKSRFARSFNDGMDVACVDPVALSGIPVQSYFSGKLGYLAVDTTRTQWLELAGKIQTPFVDLPGLASAQCVQRDGASYLAVTMHPDPQTQRPNDIPGDVRIAGRLLSDWGLHLIDINLVTGNLLEIVRKQTVVYQGRLLTLNF